VAHLDALLAYFEAPSRFFNRLSCSCSVSSTLVCEPVCAALSFSSTSNLLMSLSLLSSDEAKLNRQRP
jgi:hypothetical protein